ncbi:MAG: hypothetical protein KR126chlam1_01419 [Chlamydiae bacterium]|nr:hypothetical protein [Chlamydiota bacterium]
MKIAILDQKVRKNLALFKHLVKQQQRKKERFYQVAKKIYHAYVNRHTGELQFAELEKKELPESDWKSIVIQLRPTEDSQTFEVLSEENEGCFEWKEFDPEAYALLSKTIHILNQLAYDPKMGKNPLWVLRHVAHLEFELTDEENGKRSLIHGAWHSVNRYEAEHLLKGRPIGTYLFRKDEVAELLEETLNELFSFPITCITLTYSDWDEKVCEKTLVYKNGSWLIYDDDPTLRGPTCPTVKELLQTLGDQIQSPLLR